MIENWLENLRSVSERGSAGKCPFCGSVNMDYKASIVIQMSRLGYMDIWCNDCKRAFHVSRMQIPEGMRVDGEIPKDLKY